MISRLDDVITDGRQRRLAQLGPRLAALGITPQECTDNVTYALLHHLLRKLHYGAISGDRTVVGECSAIWSDRVPNAGCGASSILLTQAGHCTRVDDKNFLSPLLLVRSLRPEWPVADIDIWNQAMDRLDSAGFQDAVRAVLGIAIVLQRREATETNQSYALSALPGTIFLDWIPLPVRLGEVILHESTHCLLNELIEAWNVQVDSSLTWYSPWKQERRPALAIIHAAIAFGTVVQYLSQHRNGESQEARYAAFRAETERSRLKEVLPTVREVLNVIAHEKLTALLEPLFE